MKKRNFIFTDYSGKRIHLFHKDDERIHSIHKEEYNYEPYIYPALEFPDEVYFFRSQYCNKYIKYYQDFFIVVVVNLHEYSKTKGVQNRIPEWFVVHDHIEFPYYYRTGKLAEITRSGELIYKYTPPNTYSSDQLNS